MPGLEFYQRAAESAPLPSVEDGASGYFSAPGGTLDPNLFDGDVLRTEVYQYIVQGLLGWLDRRGIFRPDEWLHMWLAGSGISYQWSAGRGNGDLDVMLGVDLIPFQQANPYFRGQGYDDIAEAFNSALKRYVWPQTAHAQFGDQTYEVTYYLNPLVGSDISEINPYAAYEIYPGQGWVIRPPELPQDPKSLYPPEWFDRASQDTDQARELVSHYDRLMTSLHALPVGSADWHSAGAGLHYVTSTAGALFDDIHTGRHRAFSPNGKGYGDWHNFRWQYLKGNGTVQSLSAIKSVGEEAQRSEETAIYGAPIDPADVALRRAAAVHRNNPLAR